MDDNTICEDVNCKCNCGCGLPFGRNSHICHQDLLLSLALLNDDDSLDITDSPWTGSGSISVNHKNSIDGADELGWYKVGIDSNGHIKEIGDALDIVSDELEGLLPSYDAENITDEPAELEDLFYDITKGKYVKLPDYATKSEVQEMIASAITDTLGGSY